MKRLSWAIAILILITKAMARPVYGDSFCNRHLTALGANPAIVEQALRDRPFMSMMPMQTFLESKGRQFTGSSNVFIVELEGGVLAVYKPDSFTLYADAEVGAYRFSEAMGVQLVPPTVHRKHDGGSGSLQLYMETGRDLTVDGLFREAFAKMSDKSKSDVRIIQFTLGQWDDHSGNLLIDIHDFPIMIDNADIHMQQYARYGDFPYVRRGKRVGVENSDDRAFPFESFKLLKSPSMAALRTLFGDYCNEDSLNRMHAQVRSMPGQAIRYIIWNGSLWVSSGRTWRLPAHTQIYSQRTLEALAALNKKTLREDILPPSFLPINIDGIMDRTHQVLEASKHGVIIP